MRHLRLLSSKKSIITALIFFVLAALPSAILAQQFQEDFESGNGGYTSSTPEFTDGSGDYFTITNGSNTSGSYGGSSGSYFAAMDIDGEGDSSQQTLEWTGIDISGCTSLQLSVDLAESDDGSNEDWDNSDFFHIEVNIDGGGYQNVIWVENDGSGFNTQPQIDTDFDGDGDGAFITNIFQNFSQNIGSGTTVDIRITMNLNSGDEDIALDNLTIDGNCTSCSAAAEPTTQASTSAVTNTDCHTADLNWTAGNGSNTLVVLATNPIGNNPTDLNGYTASSVFATGDTLGAGEYIMYNGTGSSVSISGLNFSTTYHYAIFSFNVSSVNCDENYLTSSAETGSFTTDACTPTCPYISSIMFNSCGGGGTEGTDEYWTFETGSSSTNVDDIVVTYPNGGDYCNGGPCGSQTLGNNQPYIDQLNATAGCSPDLFTYSSTIPPNSTVLVFTGQNPSTVFDFSTQCSAAPVYVIFSNNSSGSGRFANSAIRDLTVDFGGGCNQTVTYDGNAAPGNGGTVNYDPVGSPTYSTSSSCVYPLPIELLAFEAKPDKQTVKVTWQTASESNFENYQIAHSTSGENWTAIDEVKAEGRANSYQYSHKHPRRGVNYYKLKTIDHNGNVEEIGIRSVSFNSGDQYTMRYKSETNSGMIMTNFEMTSSDRITAYDLSGRPVYNQNARGGYRHKIPTHTLSSGIYLLAISREDQRLTTKKIVVQ